MTGIATFGWYGFSFAHSDEWAPVSVTGRRREGYVRLDAPASPSLQIRWKDVGPSPDLPAFLTEYLKKLGRDARKASVTFTSHQSPGPKSIDYTYHGVSHGRGEIRVGACGRVFVLEASSPKKEGLVGAIKRVTQTFESGQDPELWSVLNLAFRLPAALDVEAQAFMAGRTRLILKNRAVTFTADRWAFADQLVATHGIEGWARAVLRLPHAVAELNENGLQLTTPGNLLRPPVIALVRNQPYANQLTILMAQTRSNLWRPQWNWFVS